MYVIILVVILITSSISTIECADGDSEASKSLNTLIDEFWAWRLRTSPEFGTKYAIKTAYEGKLEQYTTQEWDKQKDDVEKMLGQAKELKDTQFTKKEKTSLKILTSLLQAFLDGYKYRYYGTINPMNTMDKPLSELKKLFSQMKKKTSTDFENILKRYTLVPQQVDQLIALMRISIQKNTTDHESSITGALQSLVEFLKVKTELTFFYEPFINITTDIPEKNRTKLQDEAKAVIKQKIIPAFTAMKVFVEKDYMKNLRPKIGASTMPDGLNYYKACLKWHLSIEITPQKIHETGLSEIKRIGSKIKEIMKKDNFNGTLKEYVDSLKKKKELFYDTEEELLQGYRDMIQDKINETMKSIFYKVPKQPLEVRKSDNPHGATGRYTEPPLDGSRPGIFWANVYEPETRPKFNMMALALHEAQPGHHTQASFAILNKLPLFRTITEYRKYYAIPFNWLYFTTYTEGWALYAESLGEELGLYDEPYSLLGRYTSESFRAARLVVDTGIHALGWSRDKAVEYLRNNSALPESQIQNEINRYIGWPGQSTAYKLGELKIKELRKNAKKELGYKFSLKGFHQVLMDLGPAPFSLMDESVEDWIKAVKVTQGASRYQNSSNILLLSTIFLHLYYFFIHP